MADQTMSDAPDTLSTTTSVSNCVPSCLLQPNSFTLCVSTELFPMLCPRPQLEEPYCRRPQDKRLMQKVSRASLRCLYFRISSSHELVRWKWPSAL